MNPKHALETFRSFLAAKGLNEGSLSPKDGIQAMLDFYREVRADGCTFDEDADMLLFQWGTYDWGSGEHTEVDITRQLFLSEDAEDEDIWQLSLTFRFEPDDGLRSLRSGDRWCGSDEELQAFAEMIEGSDAYQATASRAPEHTELRYECAG